VLIHDVNMGKGTALRDLFAYATRANVDIVVIIDGDGQHDPDDIPRVIAPLLLDEADIVNGSRYLREGAHDTPRYRRLGQRVLDTFTRFGLDTEPPITDTQSGFRAFAIKTAPHFKFDAERLAIDSEMLMDAAKAQFRITEVPVRVRYDVGHSSAHPVSHGLDVMRGVLRNIEFERPLLIFTAPGALLLASGTLVAVWIVDVYYNIGRVVYGPTMLAILLIVVGVFLALTGVILHSMSSLVRART
ncbi:MAG: glycosyltransferase family 2 protein, partial [Halobacteriota archaeon]